MPTNPISAVFKTLGKATVGMYMPGFIAIHFRYMKHSFRAWLVLFVAPFLGLKFVISAAFDLMGEEVSGRHGYDLMAIFFIGMCFFFAERNRDFRRIYVYAVPVVTVLGLLYWVWNGQAFMSAGFIALLGLSLWLSYRVAKFSITKGYQQLSDGADKNYQKGRALFDDGDYNAALPLLEKSAKKGHFKSRYLLGQIHEHGHVGKADIMEALRYYLKAGRTGYAPARERAQELLGQLTPEQKEEFEAEVGLVYMQPIVKR